MIVLCGIAGLEVFLQMSVGLGMFLRAFGCNEELGKVKKVALLLGLLIIWLLGTYNATMCLLSASVTWFLTFLESIWLWQWSGRPLKKAFFWCIFYKWFFVVTKTPVLVICGLIRHEVVARIINHQNEWTALFELGITISIWLIYRNYCSGKDAFLKSVIGKHYYLLFVVGLGEYIGVSYLIDILNIEFEIYALVMVVIMMLLLIAFMAIIIIYMRFQRNEREKQMILSRERILENNYAMLKQEQEINRKSIHDHRHELDYLYCCFVEEDCKRGRAYIETWRQACYTKEKEEIWTGNSGIDYLINKTRKRADERKIRFEVLVDRIDIPIAEYDFFTILGNILENAIEAAEQCNEEERFVRLVICVKNEMLMLYQENSYALEPIRNGRKFVTSKKDIKAHGWGLEIIKEIVEKNEGSCSIEYKDSVFSLQIMFGV